MPGGRHQIGIPAGFISESVAGFLSECLAGFLGIRSPPQRTRSLLTMPRLKGGPKEPSRWWLD